LRYPIQLGSTRRRLAQSVYDPWWRKVISTLQRCTEEKLELEQAVNHVPANFGGQFKMEF
jgi:hypothetical protein